MDNLATREHYDWRADRWTPRAPVPTARLATTGSVIPENACVRAPGSLRVSPQQRAAQFSVTLGGCGCPANVLHPRHEGYVKKYASAPTCPTARPTWQSWAWSSRSILERRVKLPSHWIHRRRRTWRTTFTEVPEQAAGWAIPRTAMPEQATVLSKRDQEPRVGRLRTVGLAGVDDGPGAPPPRVPPPDREAAEIVARRRRRARRHRRGLERRAALRDNDLSVPLPMLRVCASWD